MTSIFKNVKEKPLFVAFFRYSESQSIEEKIEAYSAFSYEIHENGGSLSELVCRLIFEDENVYIRTRAKKKKFPKALSDAVLHELSVFERFLSLTDKDFKEDLKLDYVTPFSSERVDLVSVYEKRIKGFT